MLLVPHEGGTRLAIPGGISMSFFSPYIVYSSDPEAGREYMMVVHHSDTLPDAENKAATYKAQDITGALCVAIYQLVEVVKDEPTDEQRSAHFLKSEE